MYTLGIGCYYHDASACLLKDGKVAAAAEEERFTRKKHDDSFPSNSIKYCLEHADITIDDISHIAYYEKPFLKFERLLSQHIEYWPRSIKTFISSTPSWINQKLRVMKAIRKLGYKGDVFFIEHHMAHAASCFLASPFDKAAILTVDGVGEWTTTSYGVGEGSSITLKKHIQFPHSIGLLYSTITAYLGFRVNSGEYKVMGLSAYGSWDKKENKYYKLLLKTIDVKDDGSFALDMEYFLYPYKDRMPSKRLCKLLDGDIRIPESEVTQRHKDIAAALQMVTEDILTKILNHIHKETGQDNIVMAGGVSLNSVFNGKILDSTPFKGVWIQPDAGDGGASLGAALYAYNTVLGNPRIYEMKHAYLGPSYSTEQIARFLDENNIEYRKLKDEKEMVEETARLIEEDKVIGWFQGRMEFGPRALGARSILSSPLNPRMQYMLNLKVKHREKFRPFAPVVCEDDALDYFECDVPIPYPTDFMLMIYPTRPKWRRELPSVTHVDGSGRLQTVRRHQNTRYYDLIKEFGRRTGVPILINTSFNIRGEPIVCTPYDAYKCMMGTGIDYTVMDIFLIRRDDNPQDMWDSEKLAHD